MDSPIHRGNVFAALVPAQGERFDELARFGNTSIERIVSSATPGSDPYDQAHDEWVVLLAGHARLEVAGSPVELGPGDHVSLPAHTPHRVLSTSEGAVWLAVHVSR
ncbi:MAG TPA: cupin domain-containing protein [Polyangiales bacterium]|nr:cupin domain-containing protein [Polyangiales bacterium]